MFRDLIPTLNAVSTVGYVSHKPGGSLPLLSARPAVTLATFKRAATSFAVYYYYYYYYYKTGVTALYR